MMSTSPPTGKAANHTGIRRCLARTVDRLQAIDDEEARKVKGEAKLSMQYRRQYALRLHQRLTES